MSDKKQISIADYLKTVSGEMQNYVATGLIRMQDNCLGVVKRLEEEIKNLRDKGAADAAVIKKQAERIAELEDFNNPKIKTIPTVPVDLDAKEALQIAGTKCAQPSDSEFDSECEAINSSEKGYPDEPEQMPI